MGASKFPATQLISLIPLLTLKSSPCGPVTISTKIRNGSHKSGNLIELNDRLIFSCYGKTKKKKPTGKSKRITRSYHQINLEIIFRYLIIEVKNNN